ncbi:MAG: hypothetical protein JOY67_10180, partial [Hyphomicrobiales bacterium]|nr:hypothetical protein [Hyphomicrobiales bacterium]
MFSHHRRRRPWSSSIECGPSPGHSLARKLAFAFLLLGVCGAEAIPACAAETPKPGGSVVIAMDPAGLSILNTELTSLSPALYIADVWADGLMARDATGKRIPHIATSWAVSDDGKTYTFNLRKGLKWSDGQPFSSADVVFTLTQFAKYNTYLSKIVPLIAKVEAPDDATVVIGLTQPLAAALDLFDKENFPLMPKHIYEGT